MTMENQEIIRVQRVLMTLFISTITLSVLMALAFVTDIVPKGLLAGETQSGFLCMSLMELLTLFVGWMALRLFKMKKVHDDLVGRGAVALQKWGVLRLAMLDLTLLFNVLFYGLFNHTTFFYLAVILFICLPFVYPSLNRCQSEIEA